MIRTDHNDQKKEVPHTPKENLTLLTSTSLRSVDAAEAAASPKAELYSKGVETLADMLGNSPNSVKSLIGRWIKIVDGDCVHVLAAIEDAKQENPIDPRGWIFGRLQAIAKDRKPSIAKPPSQFEQKRQKQEKMLDETFAALLDGTITINRPAPDGIPANGHALVPPTGQIIPFSASNIDNPGISGGDHSDFHGIPRKSGLGSM